MQDDILRLYARKLGLRVLRHPRQVLLVELAGWQVVCDTDTGVLLGQHRVSCSPSLSRRCRCGVSWPFASAIGSPCSTHRGLTLPDHDTGHVASVDIAALAALSADGQVLGGIGRLVDAPG